MCKIRTRSAVPEFCWHRRNSKTTVGILRVSGEDQGLAKSCAVAVALANRVDLGRVDFIDEKASGRIARRRRKIAGILDELRKGDALIVSEPSRPGRLMLKCMEILSIASDPGIRFHAIKGFLRLNKTIESRLERYCPEIEAVLADGLTQKFIAKL